MSELGITLQENGKVNMPRSEHRIVYSEGDFLRNRLTQLPSPITTLSSREQPHKKKCNELNLCTAPSPLVYEHESGKGRCLIELFGNGKTCNKISVLQHKSKQVLVRNADKSSHSRQEDVLFTCKAQRSNAFPSSNRMGVKEKKWLEKQLLYNGRIWNLEKECDALRRNTLLSLDVGGNPGSKLELLCIWSKDLDDQRKADKKKLQQRVQVLRRSGHRALESFKTVQSDPKNLADLPERMDCYENHVCSFKKEQGLHFDEYTTREIMLEKDIEEFESSSAQWAVFQLYERAPEKVSNLKRTSVSAGTAASDVNQGNRLVANVRALDDKITLLKGHREGWDDCEHDLFLMILNKYRLNDDYLLREVIAQECNTRIDATESNHNFFAKIQLDRRVSRALCKCSEKIVMRSSDAIQKHFCWYLGYLQLVAAKKKEISNWKSIKENERRHTIDNIKSEFNDIKSNLVRESCSSDRTASDKIPAVMKKKKVLERKRTEKKHLLTAWRAKKEILEQERYRQEQKRKKEKALKMQKLCTEKKQKVVVYKMRKEEEAMETAEEKQDPRSRNAEHTEFLRVNYRDAIHAARVRRNLLEERALKNQPHLPDRPKLIWGKDYHRKSVDEVPSKHMDPTQSSLRQQHTKTELEERERYRKESSAHGLLIPHIEAIRDVKVRSFGHIAIQPRSIPSWRQNLRCA
uniref:Uncharacterized protein AlNc14C108G6300 n=1 Tax=Albugo laibachii Nc14 TaxID=890382 RepID=F0WI93_9STRA|nr:conserved hypothetical protein [Albugo laibachii Nc14]|eukprot:CCA20972.1 conserved hypothetical protein [Albugo laibachii Nc14]